MRVSPHTAGHQAAGRSGRRMITLVLLLLCMGVSVAAAGQKSAQGGPDVRELFRKGNALYQQSDYTKAAEAYGTILEKGYESGPVYYNLGNAYFKMGELGKAIVNYERARVLMPRDGDLKANLRFAQDMIRANPAPEKTVWTRGVLGFYVNTLTVDEMLWLSAVLFTIFIAYLFMCNFFRRWRRYRLYAAVFLGLTIGANTFVALHEMSSIRSMAVVIVPSSEAMFAPFDSATKFFTLQEGMDVSVVNEKEGWKKVERSDGKTGWVRSEAVEMLSGQERGERTRRRP